MRRSKTVAASASIAVVLALTIASSAGAEAISVTGGSRPGLEPFDRLMVAFLEEHKVPGAALAIARQGRLVYARGFGFADRETKELVEPDSRFRIASISKPLTAVAILELVDRGQLGLDEPVANALGIDLARLRGGKTDPRWRKVTIRHLLQHASGWDTAKRERGPGAIAEALGLSPPAPPLEVARWMLGQPLDFEPGTRHVYANFGYNLLGRVIEEVGGMPYDEFVRLRVLAPLGIRGMRIGPNTACDRLPREVRYHDGNDRTGPAQFGVLGRTLPFPYSLDLENRDASGGWVGTAIDLVRFASAFRRGAPQPLLKPETFRAMIAPPDGPIGYRSDGRPKARYYGCGWMVVEETGGLVFWHNGNLPGVSTLLVHRHRDSIDFAVLFNTDVDPKGKRPSDAIDLPIHRAIDAIAAWPDDDLFPRYLP